MIRTQNHAEDPHQTSTEEPHQPSTEEPHQPSSDDPHQPSTDEPHQPSTECGSSASNTSQDVSGKSWSETVPQQSDTVLQKD